jgi:ribosomal protein L7/L12
MEFWPIFFAVLCFLMLVGVSSSVASIHRSVSALSRIEAKLDLLLKNAGAASEDPLADLPAPVLEALRAGNKIEAIRCYREATGAGLKEAKEAVEELQRRAGFVA